MTAHDPRRDGFASIDERAAENALTAWELCAVPTADDERAFYETAARITAALCDDATGADAVPATLRSKLAASGRAFCDERRRAAPRGPALLDGPTTGQAGTPQTGTAETGTSEAGRRLGIAGPVTPAGRTDSAGGRPRAFLLGALLGVAAAILVSLLLTADGAPDLASQREVILAQGARLLPWKPGKSLQHGEVAGDVTWSGDEQKGFMRIEGLEPLPTDREYQLWIVDGARPGSAPVDGGLFSLKGRGEQLVPIDPKIPVRDAQAFVITVENKGGVVVSDQDVVVAIAAP